MLHLLDAPWLCYGGHYSLLTSATIPKLRPDQSPFYFNGSANEECLQCQETLIVNQATYSSTHVWVEAVLPVVANSLDT